MKIRRRSLPGGWYPSGAGEAENQIREWLESRAPGGKGCAAVVPHAGWAFSGGIAARTLALMAGNPETVVIAGGHLLPEDPFLLAREERAEIPGGTVELDRNLAAFLEEHLECREDPPGDNTVEIQLPLAGYFWPSSRILWIRVPPDPRALELAGLLEEWESRTGAVLAVVGSTDLTHYGPSYRFTPMGTGRQAREWMSRENDGPFVRAMTAADPHEILRLGLETRAACSSGGAAAAAEWARRKGKTGGALVEYGTSYDVYPSDSYVGYAGVVF